MTDILETSSLAPKMLIADDDPAVVRMLADQFTKMGFKVETVTSGMQALIKAHRNRPDILIIDVNLPSVDGLSVSQRLLAPGGSAIDVIVISGSKSQDIPTRCESVGARFVRKGPMFWSDINSLLATMYPDMANKIKGLELPSVDGGAWTHPRVLVIDDDPDVHSFLSSRLGKFGVETLYALDTVQGFRVANRQQPSVILCDYYIPNGDVLYLLWRLRSTSLTENIPVFVMSGKKLDDPTQQILKREVCGRSGVSQIFQKSFDTDELFGALQKICGFETKGGGLELGHS